MSEVMNRHPFFHVQKQYDKSCRIYCSCGNPHEFVCSEPLLISASLDKMYLWFVSVCSRYQVLGPCMCVPVKRISGQFDAFTPGHMMTVIQFRRSQFSDKVFVGKRQRFVGNNKRLSETTNACWKQQTLVENDKRLSETTSRQINP